MTVNLKHMREVDEKQEIKLAIANNYHLYEVPIENRRYAKLRPPPTIIEVAGVNGERRCDLYSMANIAESGQRQARRKQFKGGQAKAKQYLQQLYMWCCGVDTACGPMP